MRKMFLLISFLLITGVCLQAQTVNVTFQADMRVAIATGYLNPATDMVTCPGDFNNWLNEPPANTEKVMTDDDNDSIYTITIAVAPSATYGYKFNIGLGWDGKDEFQGLPNRSVVVGTTDMTVDPAFFNVTGSYTGVATNVTFNVDMRLPAQGDFDPAADHVFIAGNFTDWQNSAIELLDADGDTTFTLTLDTLTSGDLLIYKFVWSTSDAPSGNWESPMEGDDIFGNDNNRIYGPSDDDNDITRFWNNVDPTTANTGDGNVFFEVDMSVAAELGVFDPNIDSVQVRGGFNGWNDSDPSRSLLNQNPGDLNDWFLDVSFVNEPLNTTTYYKYFVKSDTSGGRIGYSNTGWEVAIGNTDSGNRDRPFIFQGDPAQELPLQYFDGIHPDWVIPAGTTVECTFMVDMTYATLADTQGTSPVFNPGTDTVYWMPELPLYFSVYGLVWEDPHSVLQLTDPDQDMIYSGTLTIDGPSFNGFLYRYGYTSTSGIIAEEGTQLDMRVRFIGQNSGPRTFDSPWTMPLDVWSNGAKPEEEGPEGLTSVREIEGIPNTYSLEQNFPNPFNPATLIRFSIPEQGMVTLKVYNLLGEEVATLLNGELSNGTYEVDFNGANFSSGIYFYTISANNYFATKKMILLK